MENLIHIREAVTEKDICTFWTELRRYQERDLFPDPEDGELAYFLSNEYREQVEALHDRCEDPLHYLFFCRDGQDIGMAMPVIYRNEDGKCFILEFCVFPAFRENGTGSRCAEELLRWSAERGAAYWELNCNTDQRRRFWSRLGFLSNGADEWGEPLMLRPPVEKLTVHVELLTDGADRQLLRLENSFLAEVGEEPLSAKKERRLAEAVADGKIFFFLAKRGYRAVGLCSVSPCYSTFACAESGVFDDFFIEPAFRHQGIARLLVSAARNWAEENALSGLTVGCADGDAEMYRALGFAARLGTMLAMNL